MSDPVVKLNDEGEWIIEAEGFQDITTCPCCSLPFRNEKAAQLVAERVYPQSANKA